MLAFPVSRNMSRSGAPCMNMGYGSPGAILLLVPVVMGAGVGYLVSPRNRNEGAWRGAAVGLALDVLWYMSISLSVHRLAQRQ